MGTTIDDNMQPQGIGSITTKVLRKVLKENLDTIVKNVRKVPGIGKPIANFLEKHAKSLIDFLDKVEGGAEAALVRFFVNQGMKESTAEIWADAIITVVSFLV